MAADDPEYSGHLKMKKVTSMESVEPGVRRYVTLQRTSSDGAVDDVMFTCLLCANDVDAPQERTFQLYTKFLGHLFHDHPGVRPFTCAHCSYCSESYCLTAAAV